MQELLKIEISSIGGGSDEKSLCACFVSLNTRVPWAVFFGLSENICMEQCCNYKKYKRKHRNPIWEYKNNPNTTIVKGDYCSETYTPLLKTQITATATSCE